MNYPYFEIVDETAITAIADELDFILEPIGSWQNFFPSIFVRMGT